MRLRNVTITLDDETARWARVEAARREMSVSRFVGHVLRQSMVEQDSYDSARSSYQSRGPAKLKRGGRYPRREETHERARIR